MKPLFSVKDKELLFPGDPRRKHFEEHLIQQGLGLDWEEMKDKVLEVNDWRIAAKVSKNPMPYNI